jgi:hypothetical protein
MGISKELSVLRKSMEELTLELHKTNKTMRESLNLMSDTIKELSDNFSRTLAEMVKTMGEMKVQVDVRDSVLKSLGIDGVIPDFFKKRK